MRHVSRSGYVCARWSLVITPLLLLAAACGAAPDAGGSAEPAALLLAPAAARPFTCVSPRRSYPAVKATGALAGDALDHLTLTLAGSGGVLVEALAPVAAPDLDGGTWTARYGLQPWALQLGPAGAYYMLLPATPGEAFTAYYLTVSSVGVHALRPLSCSAPLQVAPAQPPAGPPGPAVQAFTCRSVLVRAYVAVNVTGGLDAGGLPRDVRVTSAATGAVTALAPTPSYLPAFDGGSWVGAGLFAWGLDATPDLSHVILLPLAPSGAFGAMAITDYGAAGRVEVPLTCTAG
jgi:hypothetical protein